MKTLITVCGILSIGSFVPAIAQQTTKKTEVRTNADGSVTETTTTTTFNPEARQRVVTYFNDYRDAEYGLPPAYAARVDVKAMPAGWRTVVRPGVVITESQRSHLIEPAPELVKALPAQDGDVQYYIAGSNLIAVDSEYRVVDSIQIPTIHYQPGQEIEVEGRRANGEEVEIEIDEDGEIEIDD